MFSSNILIFGIFISVPFLLRITLDLIDYFRNLDFESAIANQLNRLPSDLNAEKRAKLEAWTKDFLNKERYALIRQYKKEYLKVGLVLEVVKLVITLTFLFSSSFVFLEQIYSFINSLNVLPAWLIKPFSHAMVLIALGAIPAVIGFFASIYSTFVIEEKFGFNRTTLKTFISDRLKGLLLSILLGLPVLITVLWFFDNFSNAYLYAFGFTTLFSWGMGFLAPVLILPLFFKSKVLSEGALNESITNYLKKIGLKMKGLFVVDGSKRSSKANAFFTGFGRFRRIMLFDTLVDHYSVEESVSVLAHEVGHMKLKHTLKGLLLSTIEQFLMFYVLQLFLNQSIGSWWGLSADSNLGIGIYLFGLAMGPLGLLAGIFTSYLSRRNEFSADRYSVETYGDASALASALVKLSKDSLSDPFPMGARIWLEYSHPPLYTRLAAIASN